MADRSITVNVRANTAGFNAGMSQASARTRALADAARTAGVGVRGLGTAGRGAHVGLAQVASGASASQRSFAQMSTAGTGAMGTLRGGIKGVMAPMAGFAALAGTGLGIKEVITQGNDMVTSMETWKAITGATGGQMEQMRGVAHGLGEDMSLPTVTSASAAKAMLALSKASFSAEDSMAAVRDISVMATAEMIDVESAATMAGDMMNQFGLKASDTARVVDVLTSATNASTISVSDMYDSMKYIGPVANSAKVSFEDTATAVAMLGNAGIKGGEAGTAMRGVLASLSAPSTQASKAMKELGINVYDQQGKFKGLKPLVTQLTAAKKRMTDQEFSNAAAVAFGRETLSGVMVLAQQGPETFGEVAEAVRKQGSAMELAAVKTKGLGGAMNALSSQISMVGIKIYESIAPSLEKVTRALADLVKQAIPMVSAGFDKAKEAIRAFGEIFNTTFSAFAPALGPAIAAAGTLASAFGGLSGPLQATALGIGALVAMRGPVSSLGTSIGQTSQEFRRIAALNRELRPEIHHTATAFQVLGQRSPAIAQMGNAFMSAHGSASRFGRTAGTVAAAGKGLQLAGSGIANMFGGPLGFALSGATLAMGLWANSTAKAQQAAEKQRNYVKDLTDELIKSDGAITESTKAMATKELVERKVAGTGKSILELSKKQKISQSELTDAILGNRDALDSIVGKLRETADKTMVTVYHGSRAERVFTDEGNAANKLADDIENLAKGHSDAAKGARDHTEATRASQHPLSGVKEKIDKLNESMRDGTATGQQLTEIMDELSGRTVSVVEAQASATISNDSFKESIDALSKEYKGLGKAMKANKAEIDAESSAGSQLVQIIRSRVDKSNDLLSALGSEGKSKKELAEAYDKEFAKIIKATGAKGKEKEAIEALVKSILATPEVAYTKFKNNKKEVDQQLRDLRDNLDQIPTGKEVKVDVDDANAIKDINSFKGVKIDPKTGKILIEDEKAKEELKKWLTESIPDKTVKFKGNNKDAKKKKKEAESWTLPDILQKTNGDIADAIKKQAEAMAGGKKVSKQKNTQKIDGNEKKAAQARNAAFKGGAKLTSAVFTQYIGGNSSGADRALKQVNNAHISKKTAYIYGNRSAFNSTLQSIASMVMPKKTVSIVANVVGKARGILGFSAGGIVEAYANGGLHGVREPRRSRPENHTAQIAHAGSYRLFGEPETGGEAYIPLSPAKRDRSKRIVEDVVGRFGGQLAWEPTVRQSGGNVAGLERMIGRIERLAGTLAESGARPMGPAVSIGEIHQHAETSTSELVNKLEWAARGRGWR